MGEVTFNDTGSSVDEGNPTTGVCLTVSGGGASSLGCDLTLTLTTIPGKAGVSLSVNSIVYITMACEVAWLYRNLMAKLRIITTNEQ